MKFTWSCTCTLASFVWLSLSVGAHDLDDAIKNMARNRVGSGTTPGIVIATVDGDRQQVSGFGIISKDNPTTPNEHTVYEIGSLTKTFTALLLADAVARGEMTLTDPVHKFFPATTVPNYQGHTITLLDLVTQTSGLPRLPTNLQPKDISNPYADYHEQQLNAYLQQATLTRAPGSVYEYSNLGFGMLGVALSHHTQQRFDELIQQRITKPLAMANTGIELNAAMRANLAPGRDSAGGVSQWDFDAMAGAGALRSTAHDMLKYLRAHMHSDTIKTPQGLASVQKPLRDTLTNTMQIGMAWHIKKEKQQAVVWHSGATGGYTSFIGFTADGQHGVVVLSNGTTSVDDIGMMVLRPFVADSLPTEITLSETQQQQYVGQYQLAQGFMLSIDIGPEGLQAQATGQAAANIYARASDEFFYKVVDAQLSFQRDTAGQVSGVILHQGGRDMPAPRVATTVKIDAKKSITLPVDTLRRYVGNYALSPQFRLHITEENGQLYLQATGQGRNPIYAASTTEFFLKVVDAQIVFNLNEQGLASSLVLKQNGQQMPAHKME